MLCLHMWMLLVRLRAEGKDGKALAQMVYEAFQDNVEARVRAEGVKVSSDSVLGRTQCVNLPYRFVAFSSWSTFMF